MPASILIVDDEKHTREGLLQALEDTFDTLYSDSSKPQDTEEALKSENLQTWVFISLLSSTLYSSYFFISSESGNTNFLTIMFFEQ